jgi:hypothetical protein
MWCAALKDSQPDTLCAAVKAMQKEISDIGLYPGSMEVRAVLARSSYAVSQILCDAPAYALEIDEQFVDAIALNNKPADDPRQLRADHSALVRLAEDAKLYAWRKEASDASLASPDTDYNCFTSEHYFGALYPTHEERLQHIEKIRGKIRQLAALKTSVSEEVELAKSALGEMLGKEVETDQQLLEHYYAKQELRDKRQQQFEAALGERRDQHLERLLADRRQQHKDRDRRNK